jgi:hypothetical protein
MFSQDYTEVLDAVAILNTGGKDDRTSKVQVVDIGEFSYLLTFPFP